LPRAVREVLGGRDDRLEPRLLQQPSERTSAERVRGTLALPHQFADRIEASQELVVRPSEDQTAVLDRGDAEHTTRFQRSPDLDEGVERAFERLQHRVAQAGVEGIGGIVEPVRGADAKLDVSDPVGGGVLLRVGKFVAALIDAHDVGGHLGQSKRDRSASAPDVDHT
jgi:hypothetical protein